MLTDGPYRFKPAECQHINFHADVRVARILDVGQFVAEIRVRCVDCGEPFRFKGVPAGHSYRHPTCSVDGLELNAPIEPEIEKQLHARANYEMMQPPERH